MRLDGGLVFLADTRTNAGVDNVSSYRKLHVFQPSPDRVFVIESAGSLATTHEVLDRIGRDLASEGDGPSLATVSHLFEAALYLGRLSREVAVEHRDALAEVGADGTATFILGGQVGSDAADILLVYPEGNYMLELAVEAKVDLDTATTIALGSMMSTTRANLSVGPPYDLGIYLNDSFAVAESRIDSESPLLVRLRETWERQLMNSLAELKAISSEDTTVFIPPPPDR
jgi:putative proteasome-type protease